MNAEREIRCFAYVSCPYAHVREALALQPARVLGDPTRRAVERAKSLHAVLSVDIAGVEIGKDVEIEVVALDFTRHPPHEPNAPSMTLELRWKAASNASLFPSMRARLMLYPLSRTETQLDLLGWYTPPGSVLGSAANALVGHRLAEAAVHRFLEEVVARLSGVLN